MTRQPSATGTVGIAAAPGERSPSTSRTPASRSRGGSTRSPPPAAGAPSPKALGPPSWLVQDSGRPADRRHEPHRPERCPYPGHPRATEEVGRSGELISAAGRSLPRKTCDALSMAAVIRIEALPGEGRYAVAFERPDGTE